MEAKIKAVLDCLGQLKESEVDRVLKYVSELTEILSRLRSIGTTSFWHGVRDVPALGLALL